MSQKLEKFIDLFDVPIAFLVSVSLVGIKEALGALGFAVTILYTLWKWHREWKDSKSKKHKHASKTNS